MLFTFGREIYSLEMTQINLLTKMLCDLIYWSPQITVRSGTPKMCEYRTIYHF